MIKRLVLFALIAGLVYLNYTMPKLADHQAMLLARLQQGSPISADLQQKIWEDVDYSNFLICSFLKTKAESKVISSGYLNKVKLIGPKWIEETRAKLQQARSY